VPDASPPAPAKGPCRRGLAGNVLSLHPLRAKQGHSLALSFRRCPLARMSACARIEVLLPGEDRGRRSDARCLCGLAEVGEDTLNGTYVRHEGDDPRRLATSMSWTGSALRRGR
jgi:hypothetical protein